MVESPIIKEIAVVTGSRADFGIILPALRGIQNSKKLKLRLMVTGMHLSSYHGLTLNEIRDAGFYEYDIIDSMLASGTPEGISKSVALGIAGFSQAFATKKPDMLFVIGDRYETFAAVIAALPFNIPIAHLHGGECTEGAIDEAIRHSITKMSHLHFVSTEVYGMRVQQMGEESWRVKVCGAPALDHLREVKLLDRIQLQEKFGLRIPDKFLLVTFHPVTLEHECTREHVDALLGAIRDTQMPAIFTGSNADTSGHMIMEKIHRFVSEEPQHQFVQSLGTEGYFSLMTHASVMVGNSSSGIVEAASFRLPVVNIGNRQKHRLSDVNVVNVPCQRQRILEAIQLCLSDHFVKNLAHLKNSYDRGGASNIIVEMLENAPADEKLIHKKFVDNFKV